jgi:hypothetical protein
MLKHNQDGGGVTVVLLVLTILLLCGAIGFGAWAFTGRQDYKTNVETKVNAAVTTARTQQGTIDKQKFAEESKSPLITYSGPAAVGSLVVGFPNTWGAYVDDTHAGDPPINGYFYPTVVPSITDSDSVFALRVKVLNQAYSDVVQRFKDQKGLTFSAYALPKVPQSVGIRLKGSVPLNPGTKTVDMVVLPLRSQTLEVWTEGTQFGSDFETYILPNLTFSP